MASTVASWLFLCPHVKSGKSGMKGICLASFNSNLLTRSLYLLTQPAFLLLLLFLNMNGLQDTLWQIPAQRMEAVFLACLHDFPRSGPSLLPSLILHSALCMLYFSQTGPHTVASIPQVSTAWPVSAQVLYTLQDSKVKFRAMKAKNVPLAGLRGYPQPHLPLVSPCGSALRVPDRKNRTERRGENTQGRK